MKPDTSAGGLKISEAADSATFSVHVQPRASKNELCGVQGDALKLRLTSPPVEGEANRLCVEFIAKLLRVPKSAVTIVAGERSRHKTIRVMGVTAAAVTGLLR
ncbi:DUF167 domain-containing protein [Geobacter pickeringii]|uniref:UPF0235 protein GPICK_11910 n=1 Tax=Geobacter pickeringii TaxID=345632 RepID=A0A0B5BHL3_9BACT|nr:DUF167 domain-containing protein [Geobacter pickeringii]AJE03965.1 hypothetical protein GPICK_11910 [Geobacter pickeringii]